MLELVLLIIVALFVFALAATMILHLVILRVPYIPTPKAVLGEMVKIAQLKGTERVYDLGAGDGRLLLAAEAAHPGITAIGVEYVPTIWIFGWLHVHLEGSRVRFLLGDALKTDVRDADAIFLYVAPHLMQKFSEKFSRELKKGTVIISNTFTLPGRKEEECRVVRGKKLYRYVW